MTAPDDAPLEPTRVPGFAIAVAAEALYLVNLMLLPGLAFLVLFALWWHHRRDAPPLARIHLRQTLVGSLWAGALLIAGNAIILLMGGYDAPHTWVVVVLYFTACHTTLILFGALGFAKALAGKPWIYPLIGPRTDG